MAHFIRHLIVFLGLSAALTTLRAEPPALPREICLRFTVFALGGADGLMFRAKPGEAPQPLKFFSTSRSPLYDYRGAARLCFYDPSDSAGAGPVAIYEVPAGMERGLLLFFPRERTPGSDLKYEVHGIDDGVRRVPAGHFTTINVSGREYAGQYGSQRIVIPQGVGAAYPGRGRVPLVLAAQVEGQWMPAGRHEFVLGARERVTLIFYPPASPTGVYPLIRRLTDSVPPP
jgi:hypothetical protein